jgi:hypothetical protein
MILRLCDGSGVAVRKDRFVRLGEWQRCFGRTIQFCGVTKFGWRNGAATWAECSGVPFGRVGVLGQASLSAYGVKPVG